jgi:hypothetical protein
MKRLLALLSPTLATGQQLFGTGTISVGSADFSASAPGAFVQSSDG